MLASGFTTFALVFIIAGFIGILIQLIPTLFMPGVTDIDPLSIVVSSLLLAIVAAGVRYLIMRRFSHIYIHRKEKKTKAAEPAPKKDGKTKKEFIEKESPEK